MICFALLGLVIDMVDKLVPAVIPVGQVAAARFFAQAALLLPLSAAMGWLHHPSRREIALHSLRAALILLATGFFVAALRFMPMADAIAIFFVEPFILTLLGGALLGEPIGSRRIIACLVGFGGALLVIQPSFTQIGTPALLPLATAGCFAIYMVLTRELAKAMHPVTLQAYTALAAVALALPLLALMDGIGITALDPVWPDLSAFWLLCGLGLAATVSHLFISFALRLAPAATIAPLQYLEIVSATGLGYLVFSDFPDTLTLLGIAIIVGSGLYVFARERNFERRPPPIP